MTIVEYTARKPAVNAYPRCIVSPPAGRPCCDDGMEPVGEPREERPGWRFVYMRCKRCGFTVRRLFTADNLDARPDPFREDLFESVAGLIWPHPWRSYQRQSTLAASE